MTVRYADSRDYVSIIDHAFSAERDLAEYIAQEVGEKSDVTARDGEIITPSEEYDSESYDDATVGDFDDSYPTIVVDSRAGSLNRKIPNYGILQTLSKPEIGVLGKGIVTTEYDDGRKKRVILKIPVSLDRDFQYEQYADDE